QVGDVDAHAAVDVVADGRRHDESARRQHGADGDAGRLVEVRGDGDSFYFGGLVEAGRRLFSDALDGLLELEHFEQFVDGGRLDGHLFGGEQGGVNAEVVDDLKASRVEARESRIAGHKRFTLVEEFPQQRIDTMIAAEVHAIADTWDRRLSRSERQLYEACQ